MRLTAPPPAPVRSFLDRLIGGGSYTAAVALAGGRERIAWAGAAGALDAAGERPATVDTRFDYASLTKPFVATLALRLDAADVLPLALPVGEVWAGDGAPPVDDRLARRTLEELLRHRSGLIAWTPLYAPGRCAGRDEVAALLLGGELLGAPPDSYSDLGYVLWALAAEKVTGVAVAALLRREVLEPLGLAGTVQVAGPSAAEAAAGEIAVCLMDGAKEVELAASQGTTIEPLPPPAPGQPQDGNSRFLIESAHREGGDEPPLAEPILPGHAGLFGDATALWRLGAAWLAAVTGPGDGGALLAPGSARGALGGPVGDYALGWARQSETGSAGPALSAGSFGHVGFTGGSLWVDPAADRVLVLLGHRRDPLAKVNESRREFHRLAVAEG